MLLERINIDFFLQVTITLPGDGVILDRIALPDNNNIMSIRVYYTTSNRNVLTPVNENKVIYV